MSGPKEELPLPIGAKQRTIDRNVQIAMAIGFYFCSSMALVFLNKVSRLFADVSSPSGVGLLLLELRDCEQVCREDQGRFTFKKKKKEKKKSKPTFCS
jgi:hypothetical protein